MITSFFASKRFSDNATQQLFEQDLDRQQYRREVMEDLAGIQNKTKALIDQLGKFHL